MGRTSNGKMDGANLPYPPWRAVQGRDLGEIAIRHRMRGDRPRPRLRAISISEGGGAFMAGFR
ncbi:hypothetical protein CXK91_12975 [Stutzerimonas stutzeri]|uniref:Uncharacterized protein n=1 Tax=Stutzerimonas stutzeri TaxID=316 RepID=A0A2S4AL62_STUST|nr:hypothetical protein CXK91_12975 [Stutzerimonas stutzeri]